MIEHIIIDRTLSVGYMMPGTFDICKSEIYKFYLILFAVFIEFCNIVYKFTHRVSPSIKI